jgi:hypothetical protein
MENQEGFLTCSRISTPNTLRTKNIPVMNKNPVTASYLLQPIYRPHKGKIKAAKKERKARKVLNLSVI